MLRCHFERSEKSFSVFSFPLGERKLMNHFVVERFLTQFDWRAQSVNFEERKLSPRCAGRGLFRFFLGGKFFDLLHQRVDDFRFGDLANDFALLED